MAIKKRFDFIEAVDLTGLDQERICSFIEKEWIHPLEPKKLDDEDIARIHLIQELRIMFGVNDEGVSVILHLVDQLYFLRSKISKIIDEEIGG